MSGKLRSQWMKYVLPQTTKLTGLTIPGTHQTCTSAIDRPNVSRCQEMILPDQLRHGIRFIDIRLVPEMNDAGVQDFKLYHSNDVVPGLWFGRDVLGECKSFLAEYPSETIIMSIKNEHNVDGGDFKRALAPFLDDPVFYKEVDLQTGQPTLRNLKVPTLDEAKGKIVLFRRYGSSRNGIDAQTGWPHDEMTTRPTSGNVPMMIQDVHNFKSGQGAVKWSKVEPFLTQAKKDTTDTWWINFTSAAGGQPPRWFADKVNPLFQEWLQANRGAERLGTIVMDFPTDPMIDYLIARNHLDIQGELRENTPYNLRLAQLSPSDQKGYIANPYFDTGNRWNYAYLNTRDPLNPLWSYTLHKVAGSNQDGIHVGDTVILMATFFTNDDFIYLAAGKDGINCFYDRLHDPKYSADNLRWVIERSPSSSSGTTLIMEGDAVRLRNLYSKTNGYSGYLLAARDFFLGALPPDHNPYTANSFPGGFNWMFTA